LLKLTFLRTCYPSRQILTRGDKSPPPLTWNGGSQCHKHHGGHGVPEADGAAEVGRQVPDEGGEEADGADGDQEAGPAVPVLSGRDAGEQDLPEDGDEMHDVVVAGGKAFLAALVIVSVTWSGLECV